MSFQPEERKVAEHKVAEHIAKIFVGFEEELKKNEEQKKLRWGEYQPTATPKGELFLEVADKYFPSVIITWINIKSVYERRTAVFELKICAENLHNEDRINKPTETPEVIRARILREIFIKKCTKILKELPTDDGLPIIKPTQAGQTTYIPSETDFMGSLLASVQRMQTGCKELEMHCDDPVKKESLSKLRIKIKDIEVSLKTIDKMQEIAPGEEIRINLGNKITSLKDEVTKREIDHAF